ncbi:uridine phosphorylase 1-like isoform X1 [Trichogramma pretiosum]|uniref:uridine phosphorylase 1-like isoform X1 n=2 Tax=Trichogramma pretiosum TaxID=7493 RepID=UPI0006C99EAA|nr:uridine phosphorylase 1-like isoform X1 [Trichogramma pretiosum]
MFGRGDDDGEEESTVILINPHLSRLNGDILYHLGLGTNTHDLVKMFGDVKFVCMGGAPKRMEHFAKYILTELKDKLPPGTKFQDMQEHSYRYSMYKVGPILSISHGIGVPSLQILLHEIIKLMHYAKVKNPVFFRIGTCGGIGIKAGSVVVSKGAVNEMIEPYYEQIVLGEKMQRAAKLDQDLAQELLSLSEPGDGFDLISGQTMCSYDFYEGQGRCDGAFCYFSEIAKQEYLKKLHDAGVRNIEMEATCFSALTNLANIKAAIVCVAFLNRFEGDQVCPPKNVLSQWEVRPQQIVARYIKRHL